VWQREEVQALSPTPRPSDSTLAHIGALAVQSTNGCCVHSPAERLAGLIGGQKPTIEPDVVDQTALALSQCNTGYFRNQPAEVLDLVGLGRTIAICVDLDPTADPVAVVMPWGQYRELITMKDRIAAITGQMQPGR
jgi:hypothetical protein